MFTKKTPEPDPEQNPNRGFRKSDRSPEPVDGGIHHRLYQRGALYLNQVKSVKDPDWHKPLDS